MYDSQIKNYFHCNLFSCWIYKTISQRTYCIWEIRQQKPFNLYACLLFELTFNSNVRKRFECFFMKFHSQFATTQVNINIIWIVWHQGHCWYAPKKTEQRSQSSTYYSEAVCVECVYFTHNQWSPLLGSEHLQSWVSQSVSEHDVILSNIWSVCQDNKCTFKNIFVMWGFLG